jgi:hypothetical protein
VLPEEYKQLHGIVDMKNERKMGEERCGDTTKCDTMRFGESESDGVDCYENCTIERNELSLSRFYTHCPCPKF